MKHCFRLLPALIVFLLLMASDTAAAKPAADSIREPVAFNLDSAVLGHAHFDPDATLIAGGGARRPPRPKPKPPDVPDKEKADRPSNQGERPPKYKPGDEPREHANPVYPDYACYVCRLEVCRCHYVEHYVEPNGEDLGQDSGVFLLTLGSIIVNGVVAADGGQSGYAAAYGLGMGFASLFMATRETPYRPAYVIGGVAAIVASIINLNGSSGVDTVDSDKTRDNDPYNNTLSLSLSF